MDIEKARNVLDHIRRYPQQHNQGVWTDGPIRTVAADNGDHPECGTAMCFAGWTAFLYAPKGAFIDDECFVVTEEKGKQPQHVAIFARTVLDLSPGQDRALFGVRNTVGDLQTAIDYIAAFPACSGADIYQVIDEAREQA